MNKYIRYFVCLFSIFFFSISNAADDCINTDLSKNLIGVFDGALNLGIKGHDDVLQFAELTNRLGRNSVDLASSIKSGKGLIGTDFEVHLTKSLKGEGGLTHFNRDFDGKIGDAVYEAKSGDYWVDIYSSAPNDFRSDMNARLTIADNEGWSYSLISNVPIPQEAKDWLRAQGISYVELIN